MLYVDIDPDNPESDPMFVAALDMPLDGGLISVTLPRNRLDEATALAARTACQVFDIALKRHLERGGDNDTPEMLTGLAIDPDGRHSGRPAMTDLLTPTELAVMLGMSVRTLANWRSTGKGPPYLKIGVEPPEGHQDRRKVRYQRAVAERWASAHEYRRTVAR